MNESTLTQLKVLVERAVRPVRACVARKRKMREELLAHVLDVFEEEAGRGDEQAALARTQERFGQTAELTEQLQASVPGRDYIDRISENIVGYESGESALRVAIRMAALAGAIGFVVLAIMLPIQILRGQGGEWLTIARVPSLVSPLLMAFLVFCGVLLTHGMRQAIFGPAGRSWLQIALLATVAWIGIPVTEFVLCLAVMADFETTLWEVVPVLPYGMLVPVALVAVAYLTDRECRHAREWASLRID